MITPSIITPDELVSKPAISVWQAWAWAILHAGKDVENRSWQTKYRGPLVIHASKTRQGFEDSRYCIEELGIKCPHANQLPFGAIVGIVDLIDCIPNSPSQWAAPNQYHWILANPRALPKPIPYKGKQGFFHVHQCDYCLAIHHPDNSCPCYLCDNEMHPSFIRRAIIQEKRVAICPTCDNKIASQATS